MIDILWLMLFLAIAASCDWAMGLYKKLGVEAVTWDTKRFVTGLIKIALIGAVAIGVSYVWTCVPIDLSSVGLEPQTVLSAAILLHFGRAIKNMAEALKGKTEEVEPVILTEETLVELSEGKGDE